jgi:aspartate kinase
MQIHKFGGASISTVERVKNLPSIIRSFQASGSLIIISAMGKVTNAMENVAGLWRRKEKTASIGALEDIRKSHFAFIDHLLSEQKEECEERMEYLFSEVKKKLFGTSIDNYAFFYDQVVSYGELFSSTIISFFLRESGIPNKWTDAREIVKTNNHFREAGILWDVTSKMIHRVIPPLFEKNQLIITQGFIGSTTSNLQTTLGREGSDFTAAVFANLLKAESVTIWKDVEALMNADPKQFADAVPIPELSYKEVIEMAYYGAQVIHPKTIKPLQNEMIPLFVKSFLNPETKGTVIHKNEPENLPPMYVIKENQVLLTFSTKDFSFIEGKAARALNNTLADARVKSNLSQNTAISLLICMDDIPEKINKIISQSENFEVAEHHNLTLLTVRHYDENIVRELLIGKTIILEQRTETTLQVLY